MADKSLTNEQLEMIRICPHKGCAAKAMCIKYNAYEDFLQRLVDHYYITYDPMTHKRIADLARDLLKD